MLPTFVITLREGLEASLIVGIVAAFLRKQGQRRLVSRALLGVGAAVLLCVAVGVALHAFSRTLPQRQQEGLETVIGALAVVLVTYMVVWMRRHARQLKGQLEELAADAVASSGTRGGRAMVVMAFLAVIREGFETVVFLLAAFNESGSGVAAGAGAVLGLLVAIGLGYGIYRGGVRLDLGKFFRATGLVLVLVAAGLVVTALHTAHEAGWLNVGQAATVDLSALVRPGSVQASLLTGMLGLQAQPVAIEVAGWLLYLVPVGFYVAWPPGRALRRRVLVPAGLVGALVLGVVSGGVLIGANDRSTNPDGGPGSAADQREVAATSRIAAVTITAAAGCRPDHTVFPAGALTVTIRNEDATAVSEVELLRGARIVGEKENVPPGFSGGFTVTVRPGKYTLYCPAATPERRTITVIGGTESPSASARTDDVATLLAAATRGYAAYVDAQVSSLLIAARQLAAALRDGDLAAARRAYIRARPFYEKIEPVAESFVLGADSLDADLDARAGDVPASRWRGFHRIEKGLFRERTAAGLVPFGDRLVSDVRRLRKLTSGLKYQPTELANGAQELLDEVAATKITGEEERYSGIDLLDVHSNVEGAQQAFARLRPALHRIDPVLAADIAARFAALDREIERHRTTTNPSRFVLYGQLTAADKRSLASAVKAVQEPLSKVAGKVANG